MKYHGNEIHIMQFYIVAYCIYSIKRPLGDTAGMVGDYYK